MSTDALRGLRVLELGQLIAGPSAGKTLADFGADVIKIEPIDGGDPLRGWPLLCDGTSVWREVQSRNKRSLALDLRSAEGRAAVRRLAAEADVLVAGNGDSIFRRLMRAIGRDDLAQDPDLARNDGRAKRVADIAVDPQYRARDMIVQTHDVDGRALLVSGIVPKLTDTPGRLRTPAPRLGQHTASVLGACARPRQAANDEGASG